MTVAQILQGSQDDVPFHTAPNLLNQPAWTSGSIPGNRLQTVCAMIDLVKSVTAPDTSSAEKGSGHDSISAEITLLCMVSIINCMCTLCVSLQDQADYLEKVIQVLCDILGAVRLVSN